MVRRSIWHFLRDYLLLLLCLLLICLPMYLRTVRLFEERQIALSQETLKNGVAQLDQQITGLGSITSTLGQQSNYRTYALRSLEQLEPKDYLNLRGLQEALHFQCAAQPLLRDYALLLRNGIFITNKRLYIPQEQYYGSFFRFGDYTSTEFQRAMIESSSLLRTMPSIDVYTSDSADGQLKAYAAIPLVYSMSQNPVTMQAGVFIATVEVNTLASLFMPVDSPDRAGFILTDAHGGELLRYGLAADAEAGFRALSPIVASSGLTVTLLLSDRLFTDMMLPVQRLLLWFFGAFLLLGVLVSGLLAVRSSRPVRRLLKLVEQTENVTDYQSRSRNDFETIGNAMSGLMSSVDAYRDALTVQQQRVRAYTLETMLKESSVRDSRTFQQHLEDFRACFPNFPNRYRVAILQPGAPKDGLQALPKQQVALHGLIEASLSPLPLTVDIGHRTALLLDEGAGADWAAQLTAFWHVAQERFQLRLNIALSDEGEEPEDLHRLYRQARTLLRMATPPDLPDTVVVWQRKNFPEAEPSVTLDYQDLAQLRTLLTQGEKSAALALLNQLQNGAPYTSFWDEVMERQVLYDIRGVVMRVKLEQIDHLKPVEVPDAHGELTNEELSAALAACCAEICDRMQPVADRQRRSFSATVCAFIDGHIGDSALSAAMTADRFGISEPTLQKVMRQEKRCSFYEYVEKQRYRQAFTLLTETNLPIAQIATQCGYNSLNSFYKAFRRSSELPPAAVRQQALLRRESESGGEPVKNQSEPAHE